MYDFMYVCMIGKTFGYVFNFVTVLKNIENIDCKNSSII